MKLLFNIGTWFDEITQTLRGYRTILTNLFASVVPVVQALDPSMLNLSPNNLALYTIVVALINIYWRFKTNTAVGQK